MLAKENVSDRVGTWADWYITYLRHNDGVVLHYTRHAVLDRYHVASVHYQIDSDGCRFASCM